ncbi:MAG: acetone carboxylase subunit gamma [bacterium]
MKTTYTRKQLEDLIDGKLPFKNLHRMMSNFKDADRFDRMVEILQDRVPWDDRILLPYGLHLYIVQKADGARVVKCDCGHEFGDYRENWKLSAEIFVRETDKLYREIYPKMLHAMPEWMVIREFYCPGCQTLLEAEAVPPGYPIIFDFLPDLETFYGDWLGRELPK